MLLREKKRIAAILMAVVMIITTAFFVSNDAMASNVATPTDSTEIEMMDESTTESVEATSIEGTIHNIPMNQAIGDSGNPVKAHTNGHRWNEYASATIKSGSGYDFGSHSFIVISDGTNTTVGYCMEAAQGSPSGSTYQTGLSYGKVTVQQGSSPYPAQVAGSAVFSVFGYGGTNVDPNADVYGRSWNEQDGGTYGTYLVSDSNGNVRAVRGIMIEGEVFELTPDEARLVTGLAVHSVTNGGTTPPFEYITALSSKSTSNNLWKAYVRLIHLGRFTSAKYSNEAGWEGNNSIIGSKYNTSVMSTLLNNFDTTKAYQPYQDFEWTIKNAKTNKWDKYTSTENISDDYVDASGNIQIKVSYVSYNMCNNLTGCPTSATNMTVIPSSKLTVGDSTSNFAYFRVVEGTGGNITVKGSTNAIDDMDLGTKSVSSKKNTVPFTVEYGEITSTRQNIAANDTYSGAISFCDTISDNAYNIAMADRTRYVFKQDAVITLKESDLRKEGALFSVGVQTEIGTTHGEAIDKNGNYSIQFYEDAGMGSYQDIFVINPSRTIGTVDTAYGGMEVEKGTIKIHKYSANPDITEGNTCYSLEGANFGVFKTRAEAVEASKEDDVTKANAKAIAVIVTDKDGNGESVDIPLDTYYVVETKSSTGYRLNKTIYTANISDDTPVTFNVPEEPGNDPAEVIARKKSSEGDIYIEGAVFAIRYYDIQFTENTLVDPATLGETPERTWYLKTNESGYASLYRSDCILQNSDELYLNDIGLAVIPVGTITVQEIEAPEGYIKDDTVYPFSITDNPTGIPSVEVMNERTIPNSPMKQPFEITKYGETKDGAKNPLAGAGFSVCNVKDLKEVSKDYEPAEEEIIVTSDNGKCYIWDSSKAVVLTADGKTELITDSKGYAKSIDLEYGKYIGMETTVPATFLPVDEFTINVTKDSREAIKYEFVDKLILTGRIDIHKTGEDRTYNEEQGEFENKEIVLEGIIFDIYAAEDLYDIDGNLAYASGTLVETITTDNNGDASTSDDLPLGKYSIHEKNVPAGYEQMKDEYVTLSRDCDTIKVTDESEKEKQIVYSVLKVKNKLLIPEIGTTAKDSVTLNNVADPNATTTSIDTILHKNLIPGTEYDVKTVVMDKETGKVLTIDGKEISSTTKYKPNASNGTVDVSVTYNSQSLAGKQIVFYEYIYLDGELIAFHTDIADEGQTITFTTPPPETPPTGDKAPLGIIIGIMVLACAGLIGMIRFKKLQKKIK